MATKHCDGKYLDSTIVEILSFGLRQKMINEMTAIIAVRVPFLRKMIIIRQQYRTG